MEFHEKLQELRKNRGLTQEELAEALYVSRTAISKWESGRGYPSIDSLKEIASYFSVSIDDLLSGDKILTIANNENKSNIRSMLDLLFGIVDVCSFLLIILPLYPNTIDGYIYSVNLSAYTQTTDFNRILYWILFISLIVLGVLKIVLTRLKSENGHKFVMEISIVLNCILVLFLGLTREAYAITITFILLVIKGILFVRYIKIDNK